MGLFNFLFSDEKTNASKNKVYIDKNGYYRFKDSNKLVHRWVAEKHLKRKLKPQEVVHHINRNKRDNSPGNLRVFANQHEHDLQHKIDEKNFGKDYLLVV